MKDAMAKNCGIRLVVKFIKAKRMLLNNGYYTMYQSHNTRRVMERRRMGHLVADMCAALAVNPMKIAACEIFHK